MRGFHGLNPAFFRSPHLLSDQGNVPADDSLALHRRNADLDGEYLETGSRSGLNPRLVANLGAFFCFQFCGAWWEESIDPAGRLSSDSKR